MYVKSEVAGVRRTKQEAEETRETILATAERLFLEHGVEAVSLEQITQAAGITRGAVQWHFQNKPGLLYALLDRMGSPLEQLVDRLQVDDTAAPLQALIAETNEQIARLQWQPERKQLCAYLLNVASLGGADRQRGFDRKLRAAVTKILRLAAQRGELAGHWTPELAALAYCGMVMGLVDQWLRGETEFDITNDVAAAVRAFGTSLSRESPAASGRREPTGKGPGPR